MKKYLTILALAIGVMSHAQPLEPGEKEITRHERKATDQQQQPTYESIMVAAFKAVYFFKAHKRFGIRRLSLYNANQARKSSSPTGCAPLIRRITHDCL